MEQYLVITDLLNHKQYVGSFYNLETGEDKYINDLIRKYKDVDQMTIKEFLLFLHNENYVLYDAITNQLHNIKLICNSLQDPEKQKITLLSKSTLEAKDGLLKNTLKALSEISDILSENQGDINAN